MTDMFVLPESQMARISPLFPLSHWRPCVYDRWLCIHTCLDRCAYTLMSAIQIAAIVIFWV
ncbi:hypothetical protein ACEN2J_17675 [Pseudorhodobacter sp. W20_MBD10_FR17]|uniref:hypothetical protein n=1 Tax=Pseudorhodobacter sp. W20_MBD10_FR17 TaxID=3240266 RepID=UPI003F96AB79